MKIYALNLRIIGFYLKGWLFSLWLQFITDSGVEPCGSLRLTLETLPGPKLSGERSKKNNREIQAKMLFGDTEIKATAVDIATNQSVKVYVNFMNESNPKYVTKL